MLGPSSVFSFRTWLACYISLASWWRWYAIHYWATALPRYHPCRACWVGVLLRYVSELCLVVLRPPLLMQVGLWVLLGPWDLGWITGAFIIQIRASLHGMLALLCLSRLSMCCTAVALSLLHAYLLCAFVTMLACTGAGGLGGRVYVSCKHPCRLITMLLCVGTVSF